MGLDTTTRARPGHVPSGHILAAALRVATCLAEDEQPLDEFHRNLAHLPSDGLFTLEHLLDGEEILVRAEIAERRIATIRLVETCPANVEALTARYLEHSPPAWLGAATRGGDLHEAMMPVEDGDVLSGILGDRGRRDAMLLALGRTFDDRYRRELGRAGEEAVVAGCKAALRAVGAAQLGADVVHVSLLSDQLGYDVHTPTVDGGALHLEVKTQASCGDVATFYLSRSEWETARLDPTWRLVVCHRTSTREAAIAGWTDPNTLAPHIPPDSDSTRWQSVEMSIPVADLVAGLPDLTAGARR